ncbi:glycerophosphoryl diester phosphodiesterase [Streptosporangium becharense]|uniref:glycerophosphodiester phosphodiesterase n=1 Tax=Streptosporangium becharense TaxID=1816182 RepID=A0A7W9IIY2_9ACTN|nr:glycerophosphodiester phosphodiesterase [Streptosporangium becharense]MBB2911370.1 glycerophosphoryl diester phosphodiesterase [Streptosporangium becharense]MBB5821572.1 glycerophosphoryl diester phosphodiesterase [Streptosporangium becharense]
MLHQPESEATGPRVPIVIGHRGASAHRPEHTLLSYEAAIALGADYIEPDLVATGDHVLVARHENEISDTTDVASRPEFAGRRTTKTVDGRPVTGWFTEDFTLAELKTLRARERVPGLRPGNTAFDGLAEIPTFDEVVRLARRHGVGVYPETKHPGYFRSAGLPLEEPLLEVLARHGWSGHHDPVFIQSFETANLRELRKRTELPLIQLVAAAGAPHDWTAAGDPRTYDTMVTPEGLREVAEYADGIGVDTRRVVPTGPDGSLLPPTTLIRDAHRAGLMVHAWTIRNENSQLPVDFRLGDPASPAFPRATGDVMGWLEKLYRLGLDGVFADDPGMARVVRDRVG